MTDKILIGVVGGEHVLDDDYPIYGDYLYVVDGQVVISDYHDITAKQFKRILNAKEIRNCNMFGRNLV